MPAATTRKAKCLTRSGDPKTVYDEDGANTRRNALIAAGASPLNVGAYWCTVCNEGFHVAHRPQGRNEHRFKGTARSQKSARRSQKGRRR